MSKLPPNLMPALYSYRIHDIATTGSACGYAMAIHGSMQRDLDIVAVPWTDHAVTADQLVQRLCHNLGVELQGEGTLKPHGRMVYTLIMGGSCFMDLSVMPLHRQNEHCGTCILQPDGKCMNCGE